MIKEYGELVVGTKPLCYSNRAVIYRILTYVTWSAKINHLVAQKSPSFFKYILP